jgi:lipoprotein-anchoring transpeptidase ErfK/SrfK
LLATFWVGFLKEYGFHEIPICKGKREGQKEIGKAVSLGYIRLKVGEAEKFYPWAEIGSEIEIYSKTLNKGKNSF